MRQKLSSITQSFRLPLICKLCNQFYAGELAICTPCMQTIRPLGPSCERCAKPLPDDKLLICGPCIKKPPPIDRTYIAYTFEEPLRSLLHDFKYKNGLYLSSLLCHLMTHAAPKDWQHTPCLIPVPIHPQKLKQRGFNQAAVLTQILAQQFKLPFQLFGCEKIKNTPPQASLNGEQRLKNLHKAFKAHNINYEHVILVDDLLTTGSTARELALTLKQTGVQRVDIWCCARTIYE